MWIQSGPDFAVWLWGRRHPASDKFDFQTPDLVADLAGGAGGPRSPDQLLDSRASDVLLVLGYGRAYPEVVCVFDGRSGCSFRSS
jgi:hypothetical protein